MQAAARRHGHDPSSAQAWRGPGHEPPAHRGEGESMLRDTWGPDVAVFGRRSDGDSIEINLILLVQWRALARDFCYVSLHVRHNVQEIQIARGAGDAVELGDNEAAAAVQVNVLA